MGRNSLPPGIAPEKSRGGWFDAVCVAILLAAFIFGAPLWMEGCREQARRIDKKFFSKEKP